MPRVVPDSTRARLLGFAAVLAIAFAASFGVGNAVGSDPTPGHPGHEAPTTTVPGAHDMEGMGS
ncbi:hypothetical protein BH10ACT1_BH10ACT1_12620 [soil metagenome]